MAALASDASVPSFEDNIVVASLAAPYKLVVVVLVLMVVLVPVLVSAQVLVSVLVQAPVQAVE